MPRRPRRGETPHRFLIREVRREHRPPRSWPPVLGGVLLAAAVAVRFLRPEHLPAAVAEGGRHLPIAALVCGVLGVMICRGLNRFMAGLLVATAGVLVVWGIRLGG